MFSYANRVAIVTGASSGIGHATAIALAGRGCTVLAVARREALLQELVDTLRTSSPASSHLAGDLGERAFAEEVVEQAVARYGRLDILVNNAAVPLHKDLYRISVEEAERVMRINFHACLWTTFAAIPIMLRAGEGYVVNVSSFASKVVPTHETIYAASKGALNGFSEGLWNDLAGSGIHVALVHPGPIATEIWQKLDEPGGYSGRLYPARLVADAICETIEKKRHELVVPRRNPGLITARLLRAVAPGLLRWGIARTDPLKPEALERARERAARGLPLGEDPQA